MRVNFYPFGEQHTVTGDETNHLFTGKELDNTTDLYYFGARYYDPSIGRFISVDPLADLRPENSSFAYCGNNPISRIDPLGLDYKPGGDGSEENPYVWDTNLVCEAEKYDIFDNWVNFLGFGNEREGWSGAGEYTQQAMSVWQNQGYHTLNTWRQQNRPDFELAGKIGLQVAYLPSMVMGGSAISQIAGNFSRIGIHPVLAKDVQVAVRVLKNSTRLVNHSTRWNAFQQTVRMSSARASTVYWNIQVKSYAAGYILRDFGEGLLFASPPPPTIAGMLGGWMQSIAIDWID